MAKIVEEVIVIKLSQIIHDKDANQQLSPRLNSETVGEIENIVRELLGDGKFIVEASIA